MNTRIITICLILVTISIMVAAGFYAWSIWEKQQYFQEKEKLFSLPKWFKEGYILDKF